MSTSIIKYDASKADVIETFKYLFPKAFTIGMPSITQGYQIIDYPFVSLRPARKDDKLDELSNEFYELWDEIIKNRKGL